MLRQLLGRFVGSPSAAPAVSLPTSTLLAGIPAPSVHLAVVPSVSHARAKRISIGELQPEVTASSVPHRTAASMQKQLAPDATKFNQPPPSSIAWLEELIHRWYEDGTLTADALQQLGEQPQPIDEVGANLPVESLPALDVGDEGLLGALRCKDDSALSSIATHLLKDDFVVLSLGLDTETLAALNTESEQAWPLMQPGEVRNSLGDIVSGHSPSGALRGDRFVLLRNLPGGMQAWPNLVAADEVLGAVGSSLAPILKEMTATDLQANVNNEGVVALAKRSDLFVARFPGDGLGYGAHYDGDEKCKITCILYVTDGWHEDHGGCLHILDEARQRWWSVPLRAGTMVLFRSDLVLHKVEPCHAARSALTVFMSLGRSKADVERERAALLGSMTSYL